MKTATKSGIRFLICWTAALLPLVNLAATGRDLRLVEAAKAKNQETVRSLLKQHADVNTAQGDGGTALIWAAHWNDLAMADLLVRADAQVNASNDYGVTPLWEACNNGSGAMVEKLLKAGGNANSTLETGETPLMRCARTGSLEGVNLLLAHGANVNAKETRRDQTALMWAVSESHSEIAKVLIEYGADVHARSKHLVLSAGIKASYNTFDGNYEGDYRKVDKGSFTPLLFAAEGGDVASAKVLLAAGANVNEATPEGLTALVVASANGHERAAEFLLEMGANPNAADSNGMTALHYSVLKGLQILRAVRYHPYLAYLYRPNMAELVKSLLAHGANPNARLVGGPEVPFFVRGGSPIGATPFLLASATDDVEIMREMLAAGASPGLGTEEGYTPLMVAQSRPANPDDKVKEEEAHEGLTPQMAVQRALAAVKLLLEVGANPNVANHLSQTALHFAASRGVDSIVQLLVESGAKIDAKDKYGQTPLNIASNVRPVGVEARNLAWIGGIPGNRAHKTTSELLVKLGATPLPASNRVAAVPATSDE